MLFSLGIRSFLSVPFRSKPGRGIAGSSLLGVRTSGHRRKIPASSSEKAALKAANLCRLLFAPPPGANLARASGRFFGDLFCSGDRLGGGNHFVWHGWRIGVVVAATRGHESARTGAPAVYFCHFLLSADFAAAAEAEKVAGMLSELKNGDKIVTSGGLRGTIISLKDDALVLRVPPDNLKLEISRASVVSVTTAEEGK
jgi:preprotein translocase YajC subunit